MGGEYKVVFVTVDEDRPRLNHLTGLVIRAFPGCVVYQYSNPMCAVLNTVNREIDVVLLSAGASQKNNWQLLSAICRERPGLQVIVLSDDDQFRETALKSGAWGYLTRPLTGQKLQDALLAV